MKTKTFIGEITYSIFNKREIKALQAKNLLLNRVCEECYHMSSNNYCGMCECSPGGFGQVKNDSTCRYWKNINEKKYGKLGRLRTVWG